MDELDFITEVCKNENPLTTPFYFYRVCICQPPIDVMDVMENRGRNRLCRQKKPCKKGGKKQCGRRGRCLPIKHFPVHFLLFGEDSKNKWLCMCPCKRQKGKQCNERRPEDNGRVKGHEECGKGGDCRWTKTETGCKKKSLGEMMEKMYPNNGRCFTRYKLKCCCKNSSKC